MIYITKWCLHHVLFVGYQFCLLGLCGMQCFPLLPSIWVYIDGMCNMLVEAECSVHMYECACGCKCVCVFIYINIYIIFWMYAYIK